MQYQHQITLMIKLTPHFSLEEPFKSEKRGPLCEDQIFRFTVREESEKFVLTKIEYACGESTYKKIKII